MKFYFTDYYKLEEEEINEILDYLRKGYRFESVFEEFIGVGPQAYLVYDQVEKYIKTLLTPAEKQKIEADGLFDQMLEIVNQK